MSRSPCSTSFTGTPRFELELAPVRHFGHAEHRLLAQMLQRGINTPATTSMGRLFDGVASLAGLPQAVTFEGQAAIRLEHVADVAERGAYPLSLETEQPAGQARGVAGPVVLDWEPLVEAVVEDVRCGVSVSLIAARFHNGLVRAIVDVADRVTPRPAALGRALR